MIINESKLVSPMVWIGGSLVLNALLWAGLAYGTNRQIAVNGPREIMIERVTIDQEGKRTPKVIPPKKLKEIVKKLVEHQKIQAQKPPEPAHSHIATAIKPGPPDPNGPPAVQSGGNAPVGAPVTQTSGNGVATPPPPPKPLPPDPTPPAPPASKPTPPPPTPTPTPPAPPPPPPPTPKPKGASREAEASYTVEPTIPENLLSQSFKKSVRVRVHVAPDGSFTAELRSSCGNPDVDKLALEALKRWKWRPKLVDGEPVADTQTFRFEFEVK